LPRAADRSQSGAQTDPRSDLDLLEGIRRGSHSDFSVLYERYFQRVYSFAYTRLRNRADAEEVVQETFTAVFRSVDAYRGQSSLLSWIYGIAKNMVNSHVRRARAHESRLERAEQELRRPDSAVDACTPEQQLQFERSARAIQQGLESVAEWHLEVFGMRHFENLSIAEISRRTSRSSDAVRSSLYRMKRMLTEAAASGALPVA
jgi:RNA polymerase sigma-70 factor (ECF subfamily)